ncbi:hypothetical protein ACWDLG_05080 [Nonomuraea sp. NPDC003727]
MDVGRPLIRALRAAVFAVACVLVSAVLHVLAGGAGVRLETMAGALTLTWAGAFLLGRRQCGVEVLLAACFAAQYGMHHLFTAGAPPAVSAPATHGHGTGLGMLLVHVVAAVGSAWWLARGESALATLLHLAGASVSMAWAALLLLPAVPIEFGPAVRVTPWRGPVPPRRAPFAVVVSRRGPPVSFSVL